MPHLSGFRSFRRVAVGGIVATIATVFVATAALAGGGFTGPGTYSLNNGPVPFDPNACGTSGTEPFFVINQVSGPMPTTIQITFQNSNNSGTTTLTSTGFSSQGNGQNLHYWIDLRNTVQFSSILDATVVVPAGTTVGNFVWSHTGCATFAPQPPPPPPGGTPELDSILLFGSGLTGLAGLRPDAPPSPPLSKPSHRSF